MSDDLTESIQNSFQNLEQISIDPSNTYINREEVEKKIEKLKESNIQEKTNLGCLQYTLGSVNFQNQQNVKNQVRKDIQDTQNLIKKNEEEINKINLELEIEDTINKIAEVRENNPNI